MKARLTAFACATALLTGCMVGPNYQRPEVPLPGRFPEAADAAAGTAASAIAPEWWRVYGDTLLDDLERATLADNADLAQAVARIDEARAVLRAANAAFIPELDLGANAGRQALSNASPTPRVITGYAFSLSTNYEIDFWGRLRRNTEAAQNTLLASTYARDVVSLSLASATAQAYFTLRGLDALIAVTRESLATYDETVSLTRRRAEGGVASELDLRQAEGQRQLARVQLADLLRQRSATLHQLQVLTARLDLTIAPGDVRTLPVPVEPPPDLPSTLLERRPDVRQAEAALAAQNARIGVARAAMFPTISLTGDYGGESTALSSLLAAPGRIWSIGFGLALPLFDAGRREAQTQLEEARTREAVGAYQKAAQSAFREVQDALSNVRQYAASEEDARLRVESAAEGVRLAQLRYQAGYTAFLDLLIQQRTLYEAQLAAVQIRQALMLSTVDLMRALGGGWDAGQVAAARP
ncbi:MAG TPA: efflux transporter outer membrane subunit [Casimicrobiaceae bacterium]|nr:efflux transporter outer membrane subunit [Casimicrobiaceae bacterium]